MIFEALVIDTDTFYEDGTIKVRIPETYFKKMSWDLSENFEFIKDGKGNYDLNAYVYSPYGGGSNFGTVFIPQVNQRGLVVSMDNQLRKLIWLGSFFQPTRGEDWVSEKVNFPTDDINKEGEEGYGSLNGEQNLLAENLEEAKEKNFIARFKTTDKSSAESLDWEERPTSNIISIGDNAFFVKHFSKGDGWEDKKPQKWTSYSMSKNEDGEENLTTEINNEKDKIYSKVVQQENSFVINMNKEGGENYTFKLSPKDGEMKLVINEENEIVIDKDGKLTVNLQKAIDLTSGEDIVIKPNGEVKIGENNIGTLAKYEELKKIIDKLEKHIHIAPTGPTMGPLGTNKAPITSSIAQDKSKMETKKIKSE